MSYFSSANVAARPRGPHFTYTGSVSETDRFLPNKGGGQSDGSAGSPTPKPQGDVGWVAPCCMAPDKPVGCWADRPCDGAWVGGVFGEATVFTDAESAVVDVVPRG